MCTTCRDRLYQHNTPAPCPVCGTILRARDFREQTFEDTGVEREVDVRKRMARIFNKAQDDFDDLRDYNDYLEQVEELTFNLVYRVDVEQTEARVAKYEAENKISIQYNTERSQYEASELQRREQEQQRERQLQKDLAIQEELDQKIELEEKKVNNISNKKASSSKPADSIILHNNQISYRRSNARKLQRVEQAHTNVDPLSFIPTRRALNEDDHLPFDPFGGYGEDTPLYTLRDDYEDLHLVAIGKDISAQAGGFSVQDAHRRALFAAFSGLGCFISLEKADQVIE
ncbi:RNA polymerase II transcription factor B subunit 3 [Neolecta irregularis DAH-3]|uniref:RNA polymerase II transcription factor B subunit 3 n=1 Tax=Neolecta irregularis (strain DAH-3) TaxID=1198029 RepID=A0A1U7LQS4_NEOID|nr:RNA polymerase II transcription factor B subunit 3 [Neolecta irregularis DAH-3]|eukprot:OLL25007.1 RNA polymerase II transcription factor B subunit 3 [Neolecta irregularis DAH-3]